MADKTYPVTYIDTTGEIKTRAFKNRAEFEAWVKKTDAHVTHANGKAYKYTTKQTDGESLGWLMNQPSPKQFLEAAKKKKAKENEAKKVANQLKKQAKETQIAAEKKRIEDARVTREEAAKALASLQKQADAAAMRDHAKFIADEGKRQKENARQAEAMEKAAGENALRMQREAAKKSEKNAKEADKIAKALQKQFDEAKNEADAKKRRQKKEDEANAEKIAKALQKQADEEANRKAKKKASDSKSGAIPPQAAPGAPTPADEPTVEEDQEQPAQEKKDSAFKRAMYHLKKAKYAPTKKQKISSFAVRHTVAAAAFVPYTIASNLIKSHASGGGSPFAGLHRNYKMISGIGAGGRARNKRIQKKERRKNFMSEMKAREGIVTAENRAEKPKHERSKSSGGPSEKAPREPRAVAQPTDMRPVTSAIEAMSNDFQTSLSAIKISLNNIHGETTKFNTGMKNLIDAVEWLDAGANKPSKTKAKEQEEKAEAAKASVVDQHAEALKPWSKPGITEQKKEGGFNWINALFKVFAVGGLAWTLFKGIFDGTDSILAKGAVLAAKTIFGEGPVTSFTNTLKEYLGEGTFKTLGNVFSGALNVVLLGFLGKLALQLTGIPLALTAIKAMTAKVTGQSNTPAAAGGDNKGKVGRGRSALKGKMVGAGTAISAVVNAVGAVQAIKEADKALEEKTITTEEHKEMVTQIKAEAIGSTLGMVLGGAVGGLAGPLGMAAGSVAGSMGGAALAGWAARQGDVTEGLLNSGMDGSTGGLWSVADTSSTNKKASERVVTQSQQRATASQAPTIVPVPVPQPAPSPAPSFAPTASGLPSVGSATPIRVNRYEHASFGSRDPLPGN